MKMAGRFKTISFSRKNYGSKVKTMMVCIYDSEKVSRETAWTYCRQNSPSRNVLIVTQSRYIGVLKEMIDELNKSAEDDNKNV